MKYDIYPIRALNLGLSNIGDQYYTVQKIASLTDADSLSITFYKGEDLEKVISSEVGILIVNNSFEGRFTDFRSKAIVFSENPMFTFAKIIADNFTNDFSDKKIEAASLPYGVRISNSSYIENGAEISANSKMYPYSCVFKNVTIGRNCVIQSGSVIGGIGMAYVKDHAVYHKLIHLGNVIIEDNVDVGTNTSILTGILETTKIGEGTKIGNNVNIGHNVVVGKNCYISSGVTIGGACNIKDGCWISPGVTIVDHVTIEENTKIGVGSVIVKDTLPNTFYLGNPARRIG
jgi:UDP-3-O-[3-hydroxymyristoyl] glucosamine N-acyltransferase